MARPPSPNPEAVRLAQDEAREKNWKRWGPYLSERQWGTVREDYSADQESWEYLSHDQARSRAYRWGEDGLLGLTDRECRLCFSVALWNGQDRVIKERLFGLTNRQGNHGEDVKECYFYLDSTPTHSYMKALYKYPQAAFPYEQLLTENLKRGLEDPEYELLDTGIFDQNRYFDVFAEYAKASPDDILIQVRVANRGPEAARLEVLPTLWFRNTWDWGSTNEDGEGAKPALAMAGANRLQVDQNSLGRYFLEVEVPASGPAPEYLFTENESNCQLLYNSPSASPFVKDGINRYVVNKEGGAVNPAKTGTKCAVRHVVDLAPGEERVIRLRLYPEKGAPKAAFGKNFSDTFALRLAEADQFYAELPGKEGPEGRAIARQAYAGLLWSKQFYHFIVKDWLDGDPKQPAPPASRKTGRDAAWPYLFARDVISMPDKWEYPWFAAWDLAFHMISFAKLDAGFAKDQLNLLLREWYMNPNGQIPAYEWNFSDVNPPVHAWACWRVYKMTGPRGGRDRVFLARVFQKLIINFTWWVNQKDLDGKYIFSGGFLGLDNIGIFDRSKMPGNGRLEQADGTAWMAFYCSTMLAISLELAEHDPTYEDIASKFFEHFVAIADATNRLGGSGLWNEEDGFYYDQFQMGTESMPLRLRSIVGMIPLFAVEFIEEDRLDNLPGFAKRLRWFLEHRKDLAEHISYMEKDGDKTGLRLLAIPSRDRLERVLKYLLDEQEFLSPFGIRSLSRYYKDHPYSVTISGVSYTVGYEPGESRSRLFGGNSNWRGPVWFPLNYLLIEALQRYHLFYGETFTMEFPTGSGVRMNLNDIAIQIGKRMLALFLRNSGGRRPALGMEKRFVDDPHWRDYLWFHEYFHGDTGQGLGASHQTGWTVLITRLVEEFST